jgi:hypothetical protein
MCPFVSFEDAGIWDANGFRDFPSYEFGTKLAQLLWRTTLDRVREQMSLHPAVPRWAAGPNALPRCGEQFRPFALSAIVQRCVAFLRFVADFRPVDLSPQVDTASLLEHFSGLRPVNQRQVAQPILKMVELRIDA